MEQTSLETICDFVPKLKIHLLYNSAIPVLVIYPKEMK